MAFRHILVLESHIHLVKLTRLLRLARLLQKMDRYSQYTAMILTLLMLCFSLVAHWLACIWYVIAEKEYMMNDSGWDIGWMHALSERLKIPITNITNAEAYSTALYFTFTSLTSVGLAMCRRIQQPRSILHHYDANWR
ncbi:unnamed protein product [Ceratitis capitata]|uniref:(Mediterranean fruit fly) hypothetical protein n=1 Tax=Ceratitis capitata TaxID=7213 RepID=A0A811VM33_CERCA|nr:unnamed protein product [Ceratitis capitata]